MSFPKVLLFTAVALFGVIGLMAVFKNKDNQSHITKDAIEAEAVYIDPMDQEEAAQLLSDEELPQANRIAMLFHTSKLRQLPIVDTIIYSSRVPWIKGRPAWIADYANEYDTSTHFISRSLSRREDYNYFKIANGDRFNVFKNNYPFEFHLLIDQSRLKCWFYYIDKSKDERVLLNVYNVGLGREDQHALSGSLTPIGKYSLGKRVAVYKPGVMGFYNNERVEMIRTFGTRWIPFDEELSNCSEPAKGLGIHGVPWMEGVNNSFTEDASTISKNLSDGCIRFRTEDIEEIYAITVTKPTVIEIVPSFEEAVLPASNEAEY